MADENNKSKKATPAGAHNGEDKPFLSEEKIKILKDTLLKEYNEADVQMFLTIAEITRLDPFTRQLMARPEKKVKDKNGKWERMILITAYTGFLTVADRSGVYDGSDPMEWCGKNAEWTQVWTAEEPPFAARVSVWRKDHTRPETAVVYWKARAQSYLDRDSGKRIFTENWANDGAFMLGKCALAAALRKAFPNLLTQVYEESEFKSLELEQKSLENLERDVKAQEHRIAEAAAAKERLENQGVPVVSPSGPAAPRDAFKEIAPAKAEDMEDFDIQPEPDGDTAPKRPEGWWLRLSCDPIKNKYYAGKVIEDLSINLLTQAVEKWVPKVRQPETWNATTQDYRDLAEGLELALAEAQRNVARAEANAVAEGAEGPQ